MSAERRVLIVDDEETICTVVANCFEDWPGTEVDCAHDGFDAVKRLQGVAFCPDRRGAARPQRT
jgi:CheY-like chemotaxis protein